jgi:hypothetical protein
MPQFRKSVAIKMQSRLALLDSAETGVETPGKGGINKPHHASDDQMRSPLTQQRQTSNPPSVATRDQSQHLLRGHRLYFGDTFSSPPEGVSDQWR